MMMVALAYWHSTLEPSSNASSEPGGDGWPLEHLSEPTRLGLWDGVLMAMATTVVCLVLELASIGSLRALLRTPKGRSLYAVAHLACLFNNFVLGPIAYAIATLYLCVHTPLEPLACACATAGVLFVQSVGYYAAHWAMHRRSFYWAHKFHHKFAEHVVPIAANAVSPTEYAVAYMLPILGGIGFFSPDARALLISVAVISSTNLLLHTPPLERLAARHLPWWLVGTHDHLNHHRKLNTNFAAPTLNLDAIFAAAREKLKRA